LLRHNEEGNCIDKPKQPQNDKACQPIRISAGEKPLEKIAVIHPVSCAKKTFNA
jgi:hypothetical protein